MEVFKYNEEYQYLTSMLLNVTDDCNLACRYCFVEQHPHYMSLETAKTAVDLAYNNLQKKKELKLFNNDKKASIYFFGGEPTLCFNSIIVPTVQYCEEKYPNSFSFGITSNGTLLNKEKVDFFKEHHFELLLSIDGAKTTQDYNRPCKNNLSSFDLLEKNIPYLLEQFPNLCFRSTIYAPTAKYLFKNYLYAESLGFKRWEAVHDDRHPWNEESKKALQEEFSKIFLYRLTQISQGQTPLEIWRLHHWINLTINLLDEDSNLFNIENYTTVKRCGLGTTSGAVGYDGNIYGCQEQPSRDEKNIFLIGNIFEGGIDPKKHARLLEFYYNNQIELKDKKDECKNCILNKICRVNEQACPSVIYDLFKNMNSMTDIGCFIRQLYVKNIIIYINILEQLGGQTLLNSVLKEVY